MYAMERDCKKNVYQQLIDLKSQLAKEGEDGNIRCFGISKGRVVYGVEDSLNPEDQREMIELVSNVLGDDFDRSNQKTVNQWHVDLFIEKISNLQQEPNDEYPSGCLLSSKCLSDDSVSLGGGAGRLHQMYDGPEISSLSKSDENISKASSSEKPIKLNDSTYEATAVGGVGDPVLTGLPVNDDLCQYIIDCHNDKKKSHFFDFPTYFKKQRIRCVNEGHCFALIEVVQSTLLHWNCREELIEFCKYFYNYVQASQKCVQNHEYRFKIASTVFQEYAWDALYDAIEGGYSKNMHINHIDYSTYKIILLEYVWDSQVFGEVSKPKSKFDREKKCLASFMFKFLERKNYCFIIARAQAILRNEYASVLENPEIDIATVSESIEADLSAWIRKTSAEGKSFQASEESDSLDLEALKPGFDNSDIGSECNFEYETEDEFGDSDYEDK